MGNSTEIGTVRNYKTYRRPYKVRKFATDSKSQKSSFSQLGTAIKCATKCGFNVYKVIYSENDKPINIELVWENPISKIKKNYHAPDISIAHCYENNSIPGGYDQSLDYNTNSKDDKSDNINSPEALNDVSNLVFVPVEDNKDNLFKRLFKKLFRKDK